MSAPQPYKQPEVEPGQLIYWYPDGNTSLAPHAAIVTALGLDSVCCNLIVPNSHNMLIRDGVRHVSDPRVVHSKTTEARENGTWDYTNRDKLLNDLKKRLDALGI